MDFYIPPPPEPVFVPEPIVVQPEIIEPVIEEPVIEEPVQQPTGIQNVAIYEGEVDLITMQTKLAEVTLKFNESIQKIADQKQQLEAINTNMTSLQNDRESLSSQVISLQANTTAIDMKDNQINILEANIVSLTSDRDQWKTLANNWYGVAMAQLEVMVNILGI